MQMILSLAVPAPRRWPVAQLARLLALTTICICPLLAQAQFNGNPGNDLTSQNGNPSNDSTPQSQASTDTTRSNAIPADSGDIQATTQLRQQSQQQQQEPASNGRGSQPEPRPKTVRPEPYQPSAFERYVQSLAGAAQERTLDEFGREQTTFIRPIRRFGANLVTDDAVASATQDPLPAVPGDYIVRAGDEINLAIWGTVDANLRLTVNRAGRIEIPRIGAVDVAGLRNSDLEEAISRRVGQTFKNFQLTATLGQVRPIRVFVSGYVEHPGSQIVSGLSSVLHAIMRAGGPSSAGSFRDIHLRRGGRDVAVFDLYGLLLKGDRDTDRLVQPDDVIFVGPVGTQVAVLGSVNQQAIYELRPDETLGDALRMAGGFNAVADRSRVTIERLADRTTGHVVELALPAHQGDLLATGDVIRAFSVVTVVQPLGNQNKHVRIEGEVLRPGDYILPPGSRIADALKAAGGMTSSAYPFGTEFTRESVRKAQEVNYDRALRDLETDISRNQANQRVTSAEELSTQAATAQTSSRLLERLRQVRPTGRVVLQLAPDATSLPDLPLEDGDTLNIPTRGTSVGVFGSVFNTGNFVFEPGHTTEQYLSLAGGPTRGADKPSIFMLRANGSVISAQQGASFWHASTQFSTAIVEPGDTIFVPEELGKASFVQGAKDWTQILYQFGLGLAGIKTLGL